MMCKTFVFVSFALHLRTQKPDMNIFSKSKVSILVFTFCSLLSIGKDDPKYAISLIPEELKKDVHVIVREHEMRYKVLARDKATLHVLEVYTILNSNGKPYADKVVGYDKLTKITLFKGAVYDQFGNLIKRLKSSDIEDQSAFDGDLFSDDRLKYADLRQPTYPYTVEFEYEVDYRFLFFAPSFMPVPDEKIATQKASLQLSFPQDLALRYESSNVKEKPVQGRTAEGLESLTWSFENLAPIKLEPIGPKASEVFPRIRTAPSKFEFEGYQGTMNSWDEFGKWIASLNKDRRILPEQTRLKIKELTKDLKTNSEKAKVLYEYLQSKTRYISIQLGIGGFQPFSASLVDVNGYGDCKALSNYMVAMLNEAGIKANYTLISAGENFSPMRPDFPSSQFNHVVVHVPNGVDTLWLECTSQTNPFAYMGSFTGGRKALAITDNGAAIVNTPFYSAENNIQSTSAEVKLQITGDATGKMKTIYSGLQYENGGLDNVVVKSAEDQKKWIQNNIQIPTFDLMSFSMINKKEKIPSATVSAELRLNRFASVSGKRVFLTPNLSNRSTFIPEKLETRLSPVVRKTAYIDYDTIRYSLPEGIYPEFVPPPVSFSSQFGEYEAAFKFSENGLIYTRRVKMKNGVFPPASYNELIEFYKKMNRADHTKVVFINKT
jgi:transglutaminase-like putative cysteine protease